jgi:hypothetical protein
VPAPRKRVTATRQLVRGAGAVPAQHCRDRVRGGINHGVSGKARPRVVFIADVLVSDAVAGKIRAQSDLDPAEIVSLVRSPPPRIGRWVHDDRGTRLLVRARTRAGRDLLVVLSPLGSDAWRLASAHVHPRERGA